MPCQVAQGGRSIWGAVTNTSSGGLRISVPGGLPFDGLVGVTLPRLGLRLDALVRWRQDDDAGLQVLKPGEAGAGDQHPPSPSPAKRSNATSWGDQREALHSAIRPPSAPRPPQIKAASIAAVATQSNLRVLAVAQAAYGKRRAQQLLATAHEVQAAAALSRAALSDIDKIIALVRYGGPTATLPLDRLAERRCDEASSQRQTAISAAQDGSDAAVTPFEGGI
jgi:hypothetical protein